MFLTDEGLLVIKTIHRLRTVLQKQVREYMNVLHGRCGVGLTKEQFENIVNVMVEEKFCTLQKGSFGATLVILNEAPEVSAETMITEPDKPHAMQAGDSSGQ